MATWKGQSEPLKIFNSKRNAGLEVKKLKWYHCWNELLSTCRVLPQIHNESVWWIPVFMSVPSWQDVVCIPGSVWGAGWGNYCSSHSVRCGPYFLGGSGTAERARPGPLNDYWAPSWEYVNEEDRVKKYVRYNQVCFTTASSNKLNLK